ncbi:MAG: formylglycine-generating enzyme family protein [Proteobacteria bacterium]|nr:formylglycine-generating enzyme family protein [Pseudomonadota bacterium]
MKVKIIITVLFFTCVTSTFAIDQAAKDAFMKMAHEQNKKAPSTYETHDPKVEMAFVYIKPGTFIMGSPSDEYGREADEVQHQVTITKGFWMQKTEVTQWQWKQLMPYTKSQSLWEMHNRLGDNYAMDGISWNEIQEFIQKLNDKDPKYSYRLPTEAEWEYACRAGTTTPFSFGECVNKSQVNYRGATPYKVCVKRPNPKAEIDKPDIGMPVASYPKNPWGLFDMHGNIYEMCQDWYGNYPAGPTVDPKGPQSGELKVVRGGSLGRGAVDCRCAKRESITPKDKPQFFGFRLVRDEK